MRLNYSVHWEFINLGLIVKLIIVIPTYNEADNLPKMTEALFALPFAVIKK